jgi:hypothetical protein
MIENNLIFFIIDIEIFRVQRKINSLINQILNAFFEQNAIKLFLLYTIFLKNRLFCNLNK